MAVSTTWRNVATVVASHDHDRCSVVRNHVYRELDVEVSAVAALDRRRRILPSAGAVVDQRSIATPSAELCARSHESSE